MHIARQKLQHNFGRAAADYDTRAEFQHIQTCRVLDAALMLLPEAACIADIGCGTGYFAFVARDKRPGWNILGIDIAPGMCDIANTRCTAITADAAQLPLASCALDAAVSSLCYQWVSDHPAAFAELARALKPGGRAIIVSLGTDTLHELHAAAAAAELDLAVLPMRRYDETKARLREAGFEILLAESTREIRYYPDVVALLNSMRAIGAGNNFVKKTMPSITPKRFAALAAYYEQWRTPQGIPATWEHQFFVLSTSA